MDEYRYRAADGIAFRPVAGGGVLVDLRSGRYYGLNGTAAFIWNCLVDPAEGRRSPADYAAAFAVGPEEARRDFEAVTRDLLAQGFLAK